MWGQDKFGNFRMINVVEDVGLNQLSGSIRFRLQAEGFMSAYVVGDFNGWEKTEQFKLNWSVNHQDGHFELANVIHLSEKLAPGIYEYSYILLDINGDEVTLSLRDNKFTPFRLDWKEVHACVLIKSSSNEVTRGFPLELFSVSHFPNNRWGQAMGEWSYSPKHPEINLTSGRLFVGENTTDIEKVTVSFIDPFSGLKAERVFKLNSNQFNGPLVHFMKRDHQYSSDYYQWEFWAYNRAGGYGAVNFGVDSDVGMVAHLNTDHVIARKRAWGGNWYNDWAEQSNAFELDSSYDNYYLIHGDSHIYTSLGSALAMMNSIIEFAVMDDANKIIAYLSHKPMVDTIFDLYINFEHCKDVNVLVKEEEKKVILTNIPQHFDSNDFIEVRANNTFAPCRVTLRNHLDKFSYDGDDLGVVFSSEAIKLRLWAPTAKRVEVLIYSDWDVHNQDTEECLDLDFECDNGTHSITLERRHYENKYYLYRLYFDEINHFGAVVSKVTYAVDPYAVGVGLNGNKGVLIDLTSNLTTPSGWRDMNDLPAMAKEDAIIYEMHIRDFTISDNSGVVKELRGKFIGAAQTGTTYTGSLTGTTVSTGVDSLVELGITHVHLLPISDYSSVNEATLDISDSRNWGYDPQNYNVPDGSYSLQPEVPSSRILELRRMIQRFHNKGLRVVMDVVYNHMTDSVNLDNIVPGYYFRSDGTGKYTNGSGCGNELATEHKMVGKMIIDSVVHWLKNYKIDGFRFDLMELIDLDTVKKIVAVTKAIKPGVLIYGEPWKGGDSPLINGTYRGTQRNQDFSLFNDVFRDAIRGSNNPGKGFINGGQHNPTKAWSLVEGLKGSVNTLTAQPSETINYIDAHDNYTLWDQIEKSQNLSLEMGNYRRGLPNDPLESPLVRQNLLGMGILFTAQGIPFMQGGAEILRTKNGDHNSYKSDDKTNAIHWEDKIRYLSVFNYVKGLIQLRKLHPAFRLSTKSQIEKHMSVNFAYNDEKSGVVISHLRDYANGDTWQDIVIIYNATAIDNYNANILLPIPESGVWHVVVDHQQAGVTTISKIINGRVPLLRSYSMMVIHS